VFLRPTQRPPKFSFFGHFGSPNTGNESTLLSIESRLRELYPDSDFLCICSDPKVVTARDGIDAIAITTKGARVANPDAPRRRRAANALVGLYAELRQYVRAFVKLKGTDTLIVPGTGLVNDAFGLSQWGPLGMFRWVLMAKLRGCRVLIISVGAGPIDTALGRMLIKAIFRLADYRSYRDDVSRDCLRGIGFAAEADPVYPDLAFSLPEPLLPQRSDRPATARRVVGLGLMEYYGKYSASDPRPETFTAYLECLVAFASWLLAHDYDVRLLLGDGDTFVIDEFMTLLGARLGSYDEQRVTADPIRSVPEMLSQIAATDVVVATRFHNVLLSLLLNTPVIAISFHHKCSSLMREMNLSEYCQDIHDMDSDALIEQFQKLELDAEAVKLTIDHGAAGARAALDEQYDLLFAS
jgi:polysaccharide pyruvyl transferase WcaK-like protein